ncbi:MAG: tRNA lysidine(34) synthetase TilS, partial [Vicinamibacteria bacterium]
PRPGDRFHPLGAPGSKSLTRYLMERKVARDVRSRIPLLVRGGIDETRKRPGSSKPLATKEEILWVVGHGVAEASRASAGRQRLRFEWVEP